MKTNEVPANILAISREWYDGANSQMHAIAFGQYESAADHIRLAKLLDEILQCRRELTDKYRPKWEKPLDAATAWCKKEIECEKALKTFNKAAMAAREAGISLDALRESLERFGS